MIMGVGTIDRGKTEENACNLKSDSNGQIFTDWYGLDFTIRLGLLGLRLDLVRTTLLSLGRLLAPLSKLNIHQKK